MSFAKIRPRRGTAIQWTTANPVLAEGEQGIEVPDTGVGTGAVKMKFGDGVTSWNDLPYAINTSNIVDNLLSEEVDLSLSANQGRVLNEKITDLRTSIIYHSTQVVVESVPSGYTMLRPVAPEIDGYTFLSIGTSTSSTGCIAILCFGNDFARVWNFGDATQKSVTFTTRWIGIKNYTE